MMRKQPDAVFFLFLPYASIFSLTALSAGERGNGRSSSPVVPRLLKTSRFVSEYPVISSLFISCGVLPEVSNAIGPYYGSLIPVIALDTVTPRSNPIILIFLMKGDTVA